MNKTVIIDYVRKLPSYPRDKLLKKLARKDSYIKMLQDAFRNTIEINREISFVDAMTGRSGETRLTQINEMDDSFPDYEINALGQQTDPETGLSTGHSTDLPVEVDHKIHLSILDQVSETITAASTALTVVHKADRVGDKNLTHKETHFSKEIIHLKIDSKDSKAMDTMVIAGSN